MKLLNYTENWFQKMVFFNLIEIKKWQVKSLKIKESGRKQ